MISILYYTGNWCEHEGATIHGTNLGHKIRKVVAVCDVMLGLTLLVGSILAVTVYPPVAVAYGLLGFAICYALSLLLAAFIINCHSPYGPPSNYNPIFKC
jgi:hypothetical protein